MVVNKINSLESCQVNCIKDNLPGIYFLFDENKELVYIGESKFPLIRVLDHYHKHYKKKRNVKTGYQKKGIGPIFNYFRIINIRSEDSRIRQHFEKRWIRRFNPELNYNTKNEAYDLTWREINSFILVFENFFKQHMSWYRYINDEVLRHRKSYLELKKVRRRRRYLATGR